MKNNREWLPHLENSIPKEARGYTISMYSVALEGWRRGLTLKFINKNRRKSEVYYSLAYQGREHIFTVSRGDKVTQKAVEICRNKHLTKKHLAKAGVPTPKGELFRKGIPDNEIINYANELGYPLVVKPVDGTGGTGVIANIQNEEELRNALKYVRYDMKYPNIIVEEHFEGRGYRVYVIGNNVIGAFDRIPANVIGDGKHTVKELLRLKLKERDKNPALFKRPIKIDKEMKNILKAKGYTMSSIPKQNERVMLKTKNNVSSGGDSIDVTDELTKEIKDIAVKALKAIPNLEQCGIDLIIDTKNNTGVVLEMNSVPSIRNHLFPNEGQARDIPKAIIDYYFPETKSFSYLDKCLYYFDFRSVFEAFQLGIADEITVPNVPRGDLSETAFTVSGKILGVNYDKWLRRQVRNLNLNGFIKYLWDNKALVVVSGPTSSIVKFRKVINNKTSKRAKIEKVVEQEYSSPIKVGFEIINNNIDRELKDGYFPVRLKDPKRVNKKKSRRNRNNTLRKERDLYKKKYNQIINSRSWKITKPIRKIGSILKKN